jgi:hypothetical protein
MLWGLAGGFLIVFSELLITPHRFPEIWQRAVATVAFMSVVLTVVLYLDVRWTRKVRRDRDEVVSFVQRQVTKVWWLLVGLGILLTFGTMLYGGGYLLFVEWLVLVGLGLVIHGLFSPQPLVGYGACILGVGILTVALRWPYDMTRWLAASVYAIGLPAAAIMLPKPGTPKTNWNRLGIALWLVISCGPGLLVGRAARLPAQPNGPVVALDVYRGQPSNPSASLILSIPSGTKIPLHLAIEGDGLTPWQDTIPLALASPIEVAFDHGQPDGHYRIGQLDWRTVSGDLFVRTISVQARADPNTGLRLDASFQLSTRR